MSAKLSKRHRETADEFRQWLSQNKKVARKRKYQQFDSIADSKFYRSRLHREELETDEPVRKRVVKRV